MKKQIHSFLFVGAIILTPISLAEPLSVSEGFFDLSSTTPSVVAALEIEEVDRKEVESKFVIEEGENQEVIIEEPKKESDIQTTIERTIKYKIVEKYKIQIDTIMLGLKEKINHLPVEQRNVILEKMQKKVASKKPAVVESTTIDELRKNILLEILDYIIESLGPEAIVLEEETEENLDP